AGADPYVYRGKLLAKNPRARKLLDRVAVLAGWQKPLPKGHGRGIAVTDAFGTLLGQVIEGAGAKDEGRVLKGTTAGDPGRVLDPGIAKANIECGITFGLSYCKSEITFEKGAAVQRNFDSYELPYLAETPDLVTELMPGGGTLGGAGEIGPVTVPPALANA